MVKHLQFQLSNNTMNTLEEKIQKGKTILGKKIQCSLEVLSPLHIGSGIKLQKDFDFISENNYTLIFNKEDIEKLLSENPDIIKEFDDPNFKPATFLKKITNPRRYNLICFGRDILEFERNGDGIPYIPGSSVKGAIRTILLHTLIKSKSTEEQNSLFSNINYSNPKFASDSILKNIFGKDSNHNLLRSTSISDIFFDNKNLNLFSTYVLSMNSVNSYKWKKMGKNSQNSDNTRDATAIYSEMINAGAKSNFNFRIDDFLFQNDTAKKILGFSPISIQDLAIAINKYSISKIQEEIDFLKTLNTNNKLNQLIQNLEDIKRKISTERSDEFIFRLSWGIGWKGMTGDFLDKTTLLNVKNKLRLGKQGIDVFPKSRKIVFHNNEPNFLAGWVKVKLNHTFTENIIKDSFTEEVSFKENFPQKSFSNRNDGQIEVKKEYIPKDYITAEICDTISKPPKVVVLDGLHKDLKLNMPMGNLANLGLKLGSKVKIDFQYNKKKIPILAVYKDKIQSDS
jgi:CRISPR-associated protein Csm5